MGKSYKNLARSDRLDRAKRFLMTSALTIDEGGYGFRPEEWEKGISGRRERMNSNFLSRLSGNKKYGWNIIKTSCLSFVKVYIKGCLMDKAKRGVEVKTLRRGNLVKSEGFTKQKSRKNCPPPPKIGAKYGIKMAKSVFERLFSRRENQWEGKNIFKLFFVVEKLVS
jgi:hypothetical protein